MGQPSKAAARKREAGRPSGPTLGPPLEELRFGRQYRRFRLPAQELEDFDERLEFWDGATQTAFQVAEPVSPYHEGPSQLLAQLADRIAAVRGKPIRCFGTMDLALPDRDGKPARIMQADQSLYLHPERANIVGPTAMVVGENHYPDVVLEVDRSTDVRRHKLKLYEAWRFPEVWVDVPDESPRPRKPRRATIYVLHGEAYQTATQSRAFPGWTAQEIHRVLNEDQMSAQTVAILQRVGATLGELEGTGPDDDPWLRLQRQQARQEGLQEGRQEGRQEAFAEARRKELARRAAIAHRLMALRGLQVSAHFPPDEPCFAEAKAEDVAEAAMRCTSEADLIARLRALAGQ